MQKRTLIALSLLVALYGGQAIAADVAPSTDTAKVVTKKVTKKKVKKHKKPCVEKNGKPCHMHQQQAASATPIPKVAKESINAAPVAAAVAAPAVVVAAKPEVKAVAVSETDALALAKKYNCLACHAIDKKVVGPAWKDVALKYRGDATAQAHLVSKIATGGKGVWGSMAMPAHPQISEADRSTLAKFVLSLK